MLRNKLKMVVLIISLIMLVSTASFSTDTNIAPVSDTSSTLPGDNARTTEGENINGEGETSTGEEGTAQTGEEQNNSDELTEEIHNGDLYLFNNNIVMDKLVDGNVFIIGQNVEITGRVNGSLYVLANKVTFGENSYIVQSIYACANEIILNGAANDLYATAKKIDLNYNAFMIRDLRVNTETFNFAGGVGRNAYVDTGKFNFEKESGKSAIVYGNLEYSSEEELELSNELVQGEIKYTQGSSKSSITYIIVEIVLNIIIMLVTTLLVYFVISKFIPKFTKALSTYVGKKSLKALGIGLLGFVAFIIIDFLLLLTIIGANIFVILSYLFIIMLYVAYIIPCISLTYKINEKFNFDKGYKKILILLGIVIVLGLLKSIPYVGIIIYAIFELIGLGIILSYLYSKVRNKEVKE